MVDGYDRPFFQAIRVPVHPVNIPIINSAEDTTAVG